MIVITGKTRVAPEHRAEMRRLGERQVLLSRQEPGCLSYAFYEDAMAPGTFFFFEEWRDRAAIDFHFAQDYCNEFIERARALSIDKPEIRLLPIANDD